LKEDLLKQIEDLKRVGEHVDRMDIDEKSKRLARSGLSDEIRALKKQLDTINTREQTKLDTFKNGDKTITIPKGLYRDRGIEYRFEDGVIYQFKKPHPDKDGTLHLYHYVWLDEGKRQTKLLVRTLGRDKYGDRYFLETNYYKDKRDLYPYLTKGIDPNNQKYKKYANKVIEYMRTHEGFEDFLK
jgi:hypothetical protein